MEFLHRLGIWKTALAGLLLPLLIATSAAAMGMDFGGWGGTTEPPPMPDYNAVDYYQVPNSDLARMDVDASGNLYISDTNNAKVRILSNNGVQLESFVVNSPLGVAVHDGIIFVGSKKDRNVTAYDASGSAMYMLGSGQEEFGRPSDMAITAAGVIYVVDSVDKVVKTYDLSGNFLSSFGNFSEPSGIAIDEDAGEVFISDNRLSTVWVYGLNGVMKRYINDTNNLLGPQGIALDDENVYVACSAGSNIAVYTKTGTFLGHIGTHDSDLGGLRTPLDVSFDAAGKLFATNNNNQRVEVFGVGDYVLLEIDPSSMDISLFEGDVATTATGSLISNDPTAWTSYAPASWASVSPPSGTSPQAFTVTVDPTGLLPGIYTSELEFTIDAGITSVLEVTLEVMEVPSVLSVAPSQVEFTYTAGEPYPSANVVLASTGKSLLWTSSSSVPWLDLNPASGSTPSTVAISLNSNVDSLSTGTYSGTVTVDAGTAEGSPAEIPVTLNFVKGGTIEVSTNLDDASFIISGPLSYAGTGKSFTEEGVPVGTYTIEFDDVNGFVTPESYSLTIADGETASFSGEYADLRKRLDIIAAQGDSKGPDDSNILNMFSGNGELLKSVPLIDAATGEYFYINSIPASGDVDGDGVEELIISHDVGVITGIRADGTPVPGLDFMPFEDKTYVDLSVADLDGDGRAEIIASSTNWSANGAAVRVLSYDGSGVVDTGAYFLAYTGADWEFSVNNDRRGARVSTGDVNGDGLPEILTVQGGGYSKHQIFVRVFEVDTSGGPGSWVVWDAGGIRVNDFDSYWSDISSGDLDADGIDEIIISGAPLMTASPQGVRVLAFSSYGERLLDFAVESIRGVEIAAGDLDYDGAAEIVVAEGAFKEGGSSLIRIFDASGEFTNEFTAFDDNVTGVRASVGRVSE